MLAWEEGEYTEKRMDQERVPPKSTGCNSIGNKGMVGGVSRRKERKAESKTASVLVK